MILFIISSKEYEMQISKSLQSANMSIFLINNKPWKSLMNLLSDGQMGRIPFDQQIQNFETTLDQVASNSGGAVTIADSVARSLFFIGMGSNDYLNNYLMPNFPTRNQYNAQQFGDLLVQQYTNQLTVIHENNNW